MKKYFVFICALYLLNSCGGLIEKDRLFVISGKVYHNCAKSPYANKPLEVIKVEYGYSKTITTVGSTTTGDDGSFSINYKAVTSNEVALRIPDNPAINLYAPIDLHRFKGSNKVENYTDKDFYLNSNTQIKVKLRCSKTYTNQDTLYISPKTIGGNAPNYEKIIAPQNGKNIIVWTKGGRPEVGINYGISWAGFQKSIKSGADEIPDYNIVRVPFPTCENSPFEYELKID